MPDEVGKGAVFSQQGYDDFNEAQLALNRTGLKQQIRNILLECAFLKMNRIKFLFIHIALLRISANCTLYTTGNAPL